MGVEQVPFPGMADVAGPRRARRARNQRRVGVVVLAIIVLGGMLGIFGPAAARTTVSTADGDLQVTFPSRTRPGFDTDLIVRVTADAPLTDEVVLLLDAKAYDVLGIEVILPEPTESRAVHGGVELTFTAPRRTTMTVRFQGRTPVRQRWGSYRMTAGWSPAGAAPVEAEFRTWVFP